LNDAVPRTAGGGPDRPRVRVLALHADYRCGRTGVCCSSGWEVPVEPDVEDDLRAALLSRRLKPPHADKPEAFFRQVASLPHAARVVLRTDGGGRCVFLDSGRRNACAVHRQLGQAALPSACREFPRVVLLTPGRVSVTLSHYCPTAAATLFRAPSTAAVDPLLRVVEDPPAFPPSRTYEGLDARAALPPMLRPGVLTSWEAHARWEAHAVLTLAREDLTPEQALLRLAAAAERIRGWSVAEGPFEDALERVLREPVARTDEPTGGERAHALDAWQIAADAVPDARLVPRPPEGVPEADVLWVAPAWPSLARPVRRYLAGRAFASWLSLQGEGLRTTVSGLLLALGVLRAEAARGCRDAGRTLDAGLLKEAVRRADRLLVHLASPEALARALSRGESGGARLAAW
jgi:Fe-S-cluster containining protein